MRHLVFIPFFILFVFPSFGQKRPELFFDEFCLSVNRTHCKDGNTSDKNGFGVGAYHSFLFGLNKRNSQNDIAAIFNRYFRLIIGFKIR